MPTDCSDEHHDIGECDVMTVCIAAVHGINTIYLLLLKDTKEGEGEHHSATSKQWYESKSKSHGHKECTKQTAIQMLHEGQDPPLALQTCECPWQHR